jgi:hypothetical protein
MKKITIDAFSYDELNQYAKNKVSIKIISQNCDRLTDDFLLFLENTKKYFSSYINDYRYSIDVANSKASWVSFDIDNDLDELRGKKLHSWIRKNYPNIISDFTECKITGIVMYDQDFIVPFEEFMQKPYDINFKQLINKSINHLLSIIEKHYWFMNEEENILDLCSAHDYWFTSDGEFIN